MADNSAVDSRIITSERGAYDSAFDKIHWVDLPNYLDERGTLTVAEGETHVPFDIARTFYVYGVAPGSTRGGHAHRMTEQFVVPVAGSFTLELTDGV